MPYDSLLQYGEKINTWGLDNVIEAEQFFQISHMAMLLRLQTDGFVSEAESCGIRGYGTREAANWDLENELYRPLPGRASVFYDW